MFDIITIAEALFFAATETGILVDVRSFAEYQQGHLPSAINIPLSEILNGQYKLLSEFQHIRYKPGENKKIIVYCGTGAGSVMAAKRLDRDGYDAYSISGGICDYCGYLEKEQE